METTLAELQRLNGERQPQKMRELALGVLDSLGAAHAGSRAEMAYWAARAEETLQLPGESRRHFEDASDLFADAGDEQGVMRCQLGLVRCLIFTGAFAQARHIAQRTRDIATQNGWDGLHAESLVLLGKVLRQEHRYAEALDVLRQAQAYFDAHPEHPDRTDARAVLAWALIGSGDVESGAALAQAELDRLDAAGAHEADIANELNTLLFAKWCAGDFEEMHALQQRMLAIEKRMGRPMQEMMLRYNMAICSTQLSLFDEAKRHLHRAWSVARREEDVRLLTPMQMLLSLIAVHERQPEMAVEYAELARTNMREFVTDETDLLPWYLSLAYLAAGKLNLAVAEWVAKPALEPSIENWLELGWLRRGMEKLHADGRCGDCELTDNERNAAGRFAEELTALQATFPAPPKLRA